MQGEIDFRRPVFLGNLTAAIETIAAVSRLASPRREDVTR
jgi:hypothetical protein